MQAPVETKLHESESGQAAAVVALFLFFVFLALAALAIDGAMTYLARRDLQNVADSATLAACRVLADGGTAASALSESQAVIAKNLGSSAPFAGSNPPATNIGTGTGLTMGIEVSSTQQVRVALWRSVPTVLTQFLGRTWSVIDAHARCDKSAGGGLMPIAVQRYDGGTGGSYRDYLGNKAASGGPPNRPNVPYPTDSVTVTVAGHYGPFSVPVPQAAYTASDGVLADSNTGVQVPLLGNAAATNNPPNSMSGFVLLDIRNVGSGNALEYYNGVDGTANPNKNVSQQWIYQHGYPGPYPDPGTEVAILDGVSAAFGPKAMADAGYRLGDVVPAIIYDGYVWNTPDYAISLTPNASNPNGITGGYASTAANSVVYTLAINRTGAASARWFTPLNFDLQFAFSNGPLPDGTHVEINGIDIMPNLTKQVLNVTEAAGWSGTVRIYSESAGSAITQTQQYLSGINLIATASSGLVHGSSSNYGFGTFSQPDYSLRTGSGQLVVRQGGSISADVITFGNNLVSNGGCNNVSGTADIMLGGVPQLWGSYFSSSPSVKVDIDRNQDDHTSFSVNALAGAFTGDYTLHFTIPASSCGPQHTLDVPITILPPAANATPDKFVFIQGYALFRISFIDSNDVKGYAISPLFFDYKQITSGLRARLVPWN
jgi:hypothetical protein